MALSPHLSFPGTCSEAFSFYAGLFGGEVTMLSYRETPMAAEVPDNWGEKIVHATLSLYGCEVAGSDVQLEHYHQPQGFSVLVDIEGIENARSIFTALAEGGNVAMELQQTFWSPAYGVLTDRFGIPWEINGK